jgi:hypothetical protein
MERRRPRLRIGLTPPFPPRIGVRDRRRWESRKNVIPAKLGIQEKPLLPERCAVSVRFTNHPERTTTAFGGEEATHGDQPLSGFDPPAIFV